MSPRETYEFLNLEPKPLRPHILAAATVVFGDDYCNGRRETITFSGFTQINKWPMRGFEHRVDDQGYATFDTELISAPEVGIKGFSYELDDRVQILTNPFLPNTGHIRQIVPGKNFPAEFRIRRFGILETSTMRLAHRNVIETSGVVDAVPPFVKPLTTGWPPARRSSSSAPRSTAPRSTAPAAGCRGECAELGGRVMLRASWARPSGGTFGKGDEDGLSRLRYPAGLHLDTYLEVWTPKGTLYADAAVPLAGRAADIDPSGTELRAESDVPLVAEDRTIKARLTDVKLVMRDTLVGETATVTI